MASIDGDDGNNSIGGGAVTVENKTVIIKEEDLVVEDPLIVTGYNNPSNVKDKGILFAENANTSFSGLVQDHTDGEIHLVNGLAAVPVPTADNRTNYRSHLASARCDRLKCSVGEIGYVDCGDIDVATNTTTLSLRVGDTVVVAGDSNTADTKDKGILFAANDNTNFSGIIQEKQNKTFYVLENLASVPDVTANNTTTYNSHRGQLLMRNCVTDYGVSINQHTATNMSVRNINPVYDGDIIHISNQNTFLDVKQDGIYASGNLIVKAESPYKWDQLTPTLDTNNYTAAHVTLTDELTVVFQNGLAQRRIAYSQKTYASNATYNVPINIQAMTGLYEFGIMSSDAIYYQSAESILDNTAPPQYTEVTITKYSVNNMGRQQMWLNGTATVDDYVGVTFTAGDTIYITSPGDGTINFYKNAVNVNNLITAFTPRANKLYHFYVSSEASQVSNGTFNIIDTQVATTSTLKVQSLQPIATSSAMVLSTADSTASLSLTHNGHVDITPQLYMGGTAPIIKAESATSLTVKSSDNLSSVELISGGTINVVGSVNSLRVGTVQSPDSTASLSMETNKITVTGDLRTATIKPKLNNAGIITMGDDGLIEFSGTVSLPALTYANAIDATGTISCGTNALTAGNISCAQVKAKTGNTAILMNSNSTMTINATTKMGGPIRSLDDTCGITLNVDPDKSIVFDCTTLSCGTNSLLCGALTCGPINAGSNDVALGSITAYNGNLKTTKGTVSNYFDSVLKSADSEVLLSVNNQKAEFLATTNQRYVRCKQQFAHTADTTIIFRIFRWANANINIGVTGMDNNTLPAGFGGNYNAFALANGGTTTIFWKNNGVSDSQTNVTNPTNWNGLYLKIRINNGFVQYSYSSDNITYTNYGSNNPLNNSNSYLYTAFIADLSTTSSTAIIYAVDTNNDVSLQCKQINPHDSLLLVNGDINNAPNAITTNTLTATSATVTTLSCGAVTGDIKMTGGFVRNSNSNTSASLLTSSIGVSNTSSEFFNVNDYYTGGGTFDISHGATRVKWTGTGFKMVRCLRKFSHNTGISMTIYVSDHAGASGGLWTQIGLCPSAEINAMDSTINVGTDYIICNLHSTQIAQKVNNVATNYDITQITPLAGKYFKMAVTSGVFTLSYSTDNSTWTVVDTKISGVSTPINALYDISTKGYYNFMVRDGSATDSTFGCYIVDSSNTGTITTEKIQSKLDKNLTLTFTGNTTPDFQIQSADASTSSGWDDLKSDIIVRGTGANDPTWAVFRNNIYAYSFSGSTMQQCWLVFHIDHTYTPGSSIFFHVHWADAAAAPHNGNVVWGFEYTISKGHGQSAFGATATVYSPAIVPTVQYRHYISEIATGISSAELEIDALILVRLFRDKGVADTNTDAIHVFTSDVHFQKSKFASKNKVPNFYT